MPHDLTDVEMIFTEPCRGAPDDSGKLTTEWRVVGVCGRRTDDTGWKYREFDRGEAIRMFELKVHLDRLLRLQQDA